MDSCASDSIQIYKNCILSTERFMILVLCVTNEVQEVPVVFTVHVYTLPYLCSSLYSFVFDFISDCEWLSVHLSCPLVCLSHLAHDEGSARIAT